MDADSRPRVLISYAQGSDVQMALVGEFHGFLRECGVDAYLDYFKAGNLDIAARARAEDSLIIIASPEYRSLANSNLAIAQEWRSWVRGRMRKHGGRVQNVLPVVLPGGSVDDIPELLRSKSINCFSVTDFSVAGSASLLWLLPPLHDETSSPQGVTPRLLKLANVIGNLRASAVRKTWKLARTGTRGIRRSVRLGNEFVERISNWFIWAVGGGVVPLLCIWLLNIKRESSLQALLGNGELFIVSAVLVAATYGELLRERKDRAGEVVQHGEVAAPDVSDGDEVKRFTWPSQVSKFACFASALGAIAGYGGVDVNGPKVTTYLSIAVFLLTLVTGALIMNGIEKDR